MNKKRLTLAVGAALAAASTLSHAAPFNSFDPRSMAMGGAGVAVANSATAPFFNPSMLAAAQEDDDFAMELPIIGVRAYDPDEFIDSLDEFQDNPDIFVNGDFKIDGSITAADASISAFLNGPTPTSAEATAVANDVRAVSDDTSALSGGFRTLSDKAIQAELGAGMVIGIPSRSFGGALVANSWNVVGGRINYSQNDETTLTSLSEDLTTFANSLDTFAACYDASTCTLSDMPDTTGLKSFNADGSINFSSSDIQSSVNVRGVSLNEIGLSLAREFELAGQTLAIGITPKLVKAITLDYQADVDSADTGDISADDYTNETSNFNLDLGIAKDFENGWRTGFVVKNLIAQEYDLMRLNPDTLQKEKTGSIELKPQARIGVSHQTGWSTVALDVDVTENDPIGFEDASRYAALGVELNAFDFLQLRAGYRADMVNSDRSVASLGVGLSPFGVHFDLGVAANENEIGASMQFGLRF